MPYNAVSNSSGPISYLRHQCEQADVDFKISEHPSIADPTGSKVHYWFYNHGQKLAVVKFEGKDYFLDPHEALDLTGSLALGLPEVASLNNGI